MNRAWMVPLVLVAGVGVGCQNKVLEENKQLHDQNVELQDQLRQKDGEIASRPQASDVTALQGQLADRDRQIADMQAQLNKPAAGEAPTSDSFAGITVTRDTRAGTITVNVPGDVLFTSGDAALKPTAKATLGKIAGVIKKQFSGKKLFVDGFTDTDPITRTKDKWKDNLDLSAARAAPSPLNWRATGSPGAASGCVRSATPRRAAARKRAGASKSSSSRSNAPDPARARRPRPSRGRRAWFIFGRLAMRTFLLPVVIGLCLTGCAPQQDPGVPIPKKSGALALSAADAVVAQTADTVDAIDAARRVVAENLANADTTGYKAIACRVNAGRPESYFNMEQGSLQSTNRDFDVAVSGPGFFRVKVAPNQGDGFAYTRNGNLFSDRDGQVVVGIDDGYRLDPPVTVPTEAVKLSITDDGVVQVILPGRVELQTVGQIHLYRFPNAAGLGRLPMSVLFQQTDASGPAIEAKPGENGNGRLQQGFLEASNVSLTREKLRGEFLDRWRDTVLAQTAAR
ncbi:MAG: OmpA family protein [Tepidisphaeraceae bacterium]